VVATGTPAELKRRVGGDVIEIHARRDDLRTIAAVLEGDVDEATRRVTVSVATRADGLLAATRLLSAAGIEVDDIAVRRPTLDEVFLALTGRVEADDELAA
jgi:ABC-type multidrug transport system ATPase subunit